MKKTIIAVLFAGVSTLAASAQGSINANNAGLTPLQIGDPAINGGIPVNVGTPAEVAGFLGAGPGQITITLYAAAEGTPLYVLESPANIVAVTTNSASTLAEAQGTFAFGNPFTLPTAAIFNGQSPIEAILSATTSQGYYISGFSALGTGIFPATGATIPTDIFGPAPLINSFVLYPIPEPTTIALGGLGSAALLYFRRRKSP